MDDAERERIENSLEDELGFRWEPQMRHGHKALKLWNALVATKADNERLQKELTIAIAQSALADSALGRVVAIVDLVRLGRGL